MVFNIQLPFFTADVERTTAFPDSTFHSQFLNISVENQIPASRQGFAEFSTSSPPPTTITTTSSIKKTGFCIGSHEERQQNRRKKGEKKI